MASAHRKKISVLIPCYNEEDGIGAVIKGFPISELKNRGFKLEIIVIDNNSSDRTSEVAKKLGAKVIIEKIKGKGNAIRTGFYSISEDTDYVVMLDGDDTYDPREILRLVELLDSGFCKVAVGSRLAGRILDGSMTDLNRIGNWFFSNFVRIAYKVKVTDVLSGYFAWKREVIEDLRPHLVSKGFAIEMEMITKMARLGEDIYSVPISYKARAGETNLRPFADGFKILLMLLHNLFWSPEVRADLTHAKKLAFVSDAIMPYNKGGKEKRLYEITRRLVDSAHEVHIYTMKWWQGPDDIIEDGVHLHAICKHYPLYAGDRRSIREAIMFGLAVFKLLFVRFDVLDVDSIPFFPIFSARIVSWVKGKKLYGTWHEVWGRKYWQEYMHSFTGIFGFIVEWLALHMPDVIISNSLNTTRRLRHIGLDQEIITIPLGVDLKSIYKAEVIKDKSDIIFVGRLLAHKNADLLVKAVSHLTKVKPRLVCKIVGKGPEKGNLVCLINDLGLQKNISIIDNVDKNQDLYGLMKASKVFVLPSVREGFGLTVIEANAAGLPVVTTSHQDNAAKDLIHNGVNGYLVEPNEKDLAKGILKMFSKLDSMKPQSGIKKYDWNIVMQKVRTTLF